MPFGSILSSLLRCLLIILMRFHDVLCVCFMVIDCCGIVVKLLQDCCENVVRFLWDFCCIAVGLLRYCCGITLGFLWHGRGYSCATAVSFAVGLV